MQTLCFKASNLSVWAFDDDDQVEVLDDKTILTRPWGATLEIPWQNKQNSILYKSVTIPNNWENMKYFFDGKSWARDPSFGDGVT